MILFAQSIQLVDVIISILFKLFAINIFEFDIFNFYLVVLVPIFLQSPDVLKAFDLFVHMVEIIRRCIADCEKIKAKDHIVPSCPETFHYIIVLVKKIECIFVSIRGLERSILLKIDF